MKYKTSIELWEEECVKPTGHKESFITSVKRHAIDFGKWLNDEGWQEYDESDRWIQPHESKSVYTTEQLYLKFNRSDEPETNSGLHPIFQNITDTIFPPQKRDL